MTEKWHDDPFQKLDEASFERMTKEAYEAKIAEGPAHEAVMEEILPRIATADDFNKPGPGFDRIMSQITDTPSDREQELQRMLTNIHAVARYLLNIDENDSKHLFVGVQPLGSGWRVQVIFSGFELQVKSPSLTEALKQTLAKLMTNVSRRLDEGTKLLAALQV